MDYTNDIFDYGDWANAWFIRENKPCALRYNGTVAYYLDPDDYTKKADGTESDIFNENFEGNFMAQLPTIWVKRWEDENYTYTVISNKQIDSGFKAYAHDAGDGYVNDFIYLPMFKGSIINNKLRSIAGQYPSTATTAEQDKTVAEACGSGWQTWDWSKHCLITDLLTLISKTTNSQLAFGGGDANTTGEAPTYGMLMSGTSGSGQFYGTNDYLHHVKVFHIEDYWGNRCDTCLGLNRVNGDYLYKAVRPYSVDGDSTYTNVGTAPTSSSWIKSISVNEYGWVPSETGVPASTYYCDWLNAGDVETNSLARVCGMNSNTNSCGSYFLHLARSSSEAPWFFGASPVYNATHSGYDNRVKEDVFDYVQPQIDTIREILGVELYGFRIDKQDSNPEIRVTYMYDAVGKYPVHMDYTTGQFNYGSWANAWFITGNKPCALKYDGTVDYYLDPNDYTKKADGTASDVSDSSYAGNFMVEFPTVWIKRWEDARYQYVAIANKQIDDDFKAYAHMSEDGYVNDFVYFPMFKGSKIDDKMRSIAGQYPQTNTNASDTFTLAKTNGNDWYNWTLSGRAMINDLLTLISKTTNSQTAFGNGVMYNGSDTIHYGQIETGTNDLNTGQFFGYGGEEYTKHMKVFHIEDYWGNRADRILGLHLNQGLYKYKLTPPYHYIGGGGFPYIQTSLECADADWIVEMYTGDFGFLPKPSETNGSTSTYWCDYFNTSKTTNDRVAVNSFASLATPARQGYTGINMTLSWDYSGPNVGGSLMYIPPHST